MVLVSNRKLLIAIWFYSLNFFMGCGDFSSERLSSSEKISAAKSVSFIAIGDAGTGDVNQLQVAVAMENWCKRGDVACDFALYLGDNFYNSGLPLEYDKAYPMWMERFTIPYLKLPFPFYVTMGNHDYSSQGILPPNWDKQDIYKRFDGQEERGDAFPGKWYFPSPWYQFRAGNASFAAIDTEHLIYEGREIRAQRKVVETMAKEAARLGLDFRIAFGHHPLFSNGKHGNAGSYGSGVSKLFEQRDGKYLQQFFKSNVYDEKYGCDLIDIYISGHDHNRQLLEKNTDCPGIYIISGTGGKVTALKRTATDKLENKTLWQTARLGFVHVTLSGRDMTVTMINEYAEPEAVIQCTKAASGKLSCEL